MVDSNANLPISEKKLVISKYLDLSGYKKKMYLQSQTTIDIVYDSQVNWLAD